MPQTGLQTPRLFPVLPKILIRRYSRPGADPLFNMKHSSVLHSCKKKPPLS